MAPLFTWLCFRRKSTWEHRVGGGGVGFGGSGDGFGGSGDGGGGGGGCGDESDWADSYSRDPFKLQAFKVVKSIDLRGRGLASSLAAGGGGSGGGGGQVPGNAYGGTTTKQVKDGGGGGRGGGRWRRWKMPRWWKKKDHTL